MKTLVTLFLLAIIAIGCNSNRKENQKLKAELVVLAEENAMLAAGETDLELTVEGYQLILLEIDANIAAIDEKHNKAKELIASNAEDVEEDILMHLEHVHSTLANTKYKIKHMQKNIYELYQNEAINNEVIEALEDQLDEASIEIFERDVIIDELNEDVVDEGIVIDDLTEAYLQQAAISEVLYTILNTAYVIIGTKKELKEHGIVGEGDFNGQGRLKIMAADADNEWFVPIPIDKTDVIELYVKKIKIITTHPEISYELVIGDKITESLVILDKAAFWDKSDFLVIEITRE